MTLPRDEAWSLLTEWTPGESLRRHARAVELVMRAAAARYGDPAEVEAWGVAGMLHDADYERWPEDHPHRIVAWLRERGEPAIAHAVSAHYTRWGVPHDSALDRALLACDEPTGFVMACCLVRPDGIASLGVDSVKKRLKDKRFAATVDRAEVVAGAELLGVALDDHLAFYGGGFLDLPTGATWNEPIGHCLGPNPHVEYADISTACSAFRFRIHCN